MSNMLYEYIKAKESTVIVVPSESLSTMGFGNVVQMIAYVESLKKNLTSKDN